MRYLIRIFLLIGMVQIGFSQTDGITGPKAKNTKAFERKSKTVTVTVERKGLKGPAAKNTPIHKRQVGMKKPIVSNRKILKGPRAKNEK